MKLKKAIEAKLPELGAEKSRRDVAEQVRQLQNLPATVHASCRVEATTAAISAAFGIDKVERTATGIYRVTLETPLEITKRHVLVTLIVASGGYSWTLLSSPDSSRMFGVSIFDTAGTSQNIAHQLTILRLK